jgi:hypothetical protein
MPQPADLDDVLDRALKALGGPRAPETLLPRVLAAAAARERRPWYLRAWNTWPRGLRAASLAASCLLVAAALLWLPAVAGPVSLSGWLDRARTGARGVFDVAIAVRVIATVVWQTLLGPVVAYALVLGLVLSSMAAGLATALKHSALGRVFHS